MANTREIRRRIKSIKNTAQITKAMQMVAASKMRRAQQLAVAGRPYFTMLARMLESLRGKLDTTSHPLLRTTEEAGGKTLVVVIATDKGLCGALNTNLLREVATLPPEKTQFIGLGRKGIQFLSRMKRDLLAEFELHESPTFIDAKRIARFAAEQFLEGSVDRVLVAHTHFVNTLVQRPAIEQILPIDPRSLDLDLGLGEPSEDGDIADGFGYLIEPDPKTVLDSLLPFFVYFSFYSMMLDARASEHSARMVAMKSATDNAKQLVKDLTLEYNKVRQASITTEILEISTAQLVMQG